LLSTDLSISEIAYEVGFKTPSHFSASFLEEFGTQPSSLREGGRGD
jgi:AraC-like DNA-binding protein